MPPKLRERATVLPDPSPFVSWNSFLYQRKVSRYTHRSVFHTAAVNCELSTVNSFQKTAHHNIPLDPTSALWSEPDLRLWLDEDQAQHQHSCRYIPISHKSPRPFGNLSEN